MMKNFYKIVIVLGVFGLLLAVALPLAYILINEDFNLLGDTIMIVPVKGVITLDECSAGLIASGACAQASVIKKLLEAADDDPQVKAVVLDINSGGGAIVASRELMRAVAKTEKPVVAWIGESGASGAYYVASAADKIVADRNSITGSIGVIAGFIHYYGLMDKLGINMTVITSGDNKDVGSPYRQMTDEEREDLQELVDTIHADFVADVAVNRNLSLIYVTELADGKIYLGSEALELGLIDYTGGADLAFEIAKDLAGITGDVKKKEVTGTQSWKAIIDRLSVNIGYGIGRALY